MTGDLLLLWKIPHAVVVLGTMVSGPSEICSILCTGCVCEKLRALTQQNRSAVPVIINSLLKVMSGVLAYRLGELVSEV